MQLNDELGDPITTGGDTVTLLSSLGGLTHAPIDVGDGTYTATLSSNEAGSALVSGTVNSDDITDTESVTVNPGAADHLTFTTQPTNATADDTFRWPSRSAMPLKTE